MTNRGFHYAKAINGHYEIALGVENFDAVDLAFQDVISKERLRLWNRPQSPGDSVPAILQIRKVI